jgi:hypothetical protein
MRACRRRAAVTPSRSPYAGGEHHPPGLGGDNPFRHAGAYPSFKYRLGLYARSFSCPVSYRPFQFFSRCVCSVE